VLANLEVCPYVMFQVELRVMAALSGDEALLQAFAAGQDVHAATARDVLGKGPQVSCRCGGEGLRCSGPACRGLGSCSTGCSRCQLHAFVVSSGTTVKS
jgi:hypothetical protein